MRNGKEMELSFENSIVETIAFHRDRDVQQRNLKLAERFLNRQTEPSVGSSRGRRAEGTTVWTGVPGGDVADLLADFTTHEHARKAKGCTSPATSARAWVRRTHALDGRARLVRRGGREASHRRPHRRAHQASRARRGHDAMRTGSGESAAHRTRSSTSRRSAREARWRRPRQMWRGNPPMGSAAGAPGAQRARDPRERPRDDGLLLLYPLDPAGGLRARRPRAFADDFPPIIGFAASFPVSETAPTRRLCGQQYLLADGDGARVSFERSVDGARGRAARTGEGQTPAAHPP